MRWVPKSLRWVLASALTLPAGSFAIAAAPVKQVAQPVTPAKSPFVTAAKPRIPQGAGIPATAVSNAQVGAALPAGVAPPPMTLWRFLGIPQGLSRVAGATVNRRGNLPFLEPKPPLKALADPVNLASDDPKIKTAAQIKKEEDLAKQKIKAIKYLAKIGCGCYPGVKEALIDALHDCTEKVRYEAAKQIGNAAENNCATCSKNCCCDAVMMQALLDVATQRDADGCFVEASARVREAACEALVACRRRVPVSPAPPAGAPPLPPVGPRETIPVVPPPRETIPNAEPPLGPNETGEPKQTDDLLTEILGGSVDQAPAAKSRGAAQLSSRRASSSAPKASREEVATTTRAASFQSSSTIQRQGPGVKLSGRVVDVSYKTSTIDLEFDGNRPATVGSRLSLHHKYAFETVHLGEVEVVYLAGRGRAIAKPVGKLDLMKISKGDMISGRTAGSPITPESSAASIASAPEAPPASVSAVKSAPESVALRSAQTIHTRAADKAVSQPKSERVAAASPAKTSSRAIHVKLESTTYAARSDAASKAASAATSSRATHATSESTQPLALTAPNAGAASTMASSRAIRATPEVTTSVTLAAPGAEASKAARASESSRGTRTTSESAIVVALAAPSRDAAQVSPEKETESVEATESAAESSQPAIRLVQPKADGKATSERPVHSDRWKVAPAQLKPVAQLRQPADANVAKFKPLEPQAGAAQSDDDSDARHDAKTDVQEMPQGAQVTFLVPRNEPKHAKAAAAEEPVTWAIIKD